MTAKAKRAKKTKRVPTGTLKLDELELQQLLAFLKNDPDIFRNPTPLTGVYREAKRALEKLQAKSGTKTATEGSSSSPVLNPQTAAEGSSSSPVLNPQTAAEGSSGSPVLNPQTAAEGSGSSPVLNPQTAAEGSSGSPVLKPSPRWWW
jgi:hypothetical protein